VEVLGGYACIALEPPGRAGKSAEMKRLLVFVSPAEEVPFVKVVLSLSNSEDGAGFSTSCLGTLPGKSSSSKEAVKSGSRSGSSAESPAVSRESSIDAPEALTIESISQNCRMFMMMGNMPMVLSHRFNHVDIMVEET
jgi:hypothetical protein